MFFHALFWMTFGLPVFADPITYDVTRWVSPQGRVTLAGGTELALGGLWQEGHRLHFEDLQPQANWTHPARLHLKDPKGTTLRIYPVDRPPQGWLAAEAPVVAGQRSREGPPTVHLQPGAPHLKLKSPENFWALLLNGHASQRHWNDFAFLYQTLIHVYGYKPEQVLVADSMFRDRAPDLDGDGEADIDLPSTRAGLEEALTRLKDGLKPGHQLFLVVNDHGGRFEGESTVILWDDELTASQFASLLTALPKHNRIALFEQCYGGGFVRPTLGATHLSLAASLDLELSYASRDKQFDEFLYHFISAIALQRHNGDPVSSDGDGDGRISVKEAFIYALKHDLAPESPVLESPANSGLAQALAVGE